MFLGIEESFLTSDSKNALCNQNGGATEIQAGNGALCMVIGSKTPHSLGTQQLGELGGREMKELTPHSRLSF